MKYAVCCPGPSLPFTWRGRSGYHTVWAVNRALRAVCADWAASTDIVLFQGLLGRFRPLWGTLTSRDTAQHLAGDATWGHVMTWEDSPLIAHHQRVRPVQWTIQAAILHAANCARSATIDVHGTGGDGTPIDCTGYAGENRTPERWRREADDVAFTVAFVRRHYGATVHFILP